MRHLNFAPAEIIIGRGSLSCLRQLPGERFLVVTGGQSMKRSGVLDRICAYLSDREILIHSGIGKNPTIQEVRKGLETMYQFRPDTVIAVGGGSAIDAAKAMILFFEHPELSFETLRPEQLPERREQVRLIAVPSTSGTASEVTKTTVITDPERGIKVPLNCMANKPDVAILDSDLTDSLPANIAAETGMDALTHAAEAYLRTDCDDFDAVLAQGAILGILEWLPASVLDGTPAAREKMHHYQCIAGLAFTNAGLSMVHGIAHAFGGHYNYSHGLLNAILLPYVLEYNAAEPSVSEKLERLSSLLGGRNLIAEIRRLNTVLQIPGTLQELGLEEETYRRDRALLAGHSLMGPTKFNPIPMDEDSIAQVIDEAYYGSRPNS